MERIKDRILFHNFISGQASLPQGSDASVSESKSVSNCENSEIHFIRKLVNPLPRFACLQLFVAIKIIQHCSFQLPQAGLFLKQCRILAFRADLQNLNILNSVVVVTYKMLCNATYKKKINSIK